ncbi:hypothetical protein [Acholeplasma granularum]|uniref:hypothetical protein n=1 Tax=Acholeplasma granularum TaxID=264635 RepID=UPI0004705188|nr:hypothetical protein [Acholeplasma granularum]
MKAFLTALKNFAYSIGGLIVIIVVLLIGVLDIIDLIQNFPTSFTLTLVGSLLSTIVLAFSIIWAQLKNKILLSHGIMFFIYASALQQFISNLFSNNPTNAFDGNSLFGLISMAYFLLVSIAVILYEQPKPAKLNILGSLSILAYLVVSYILFGFNSTLITFLIILGALLLGSKVVAISYALSTLILPVFSHLNQIFNNFSNNSNQVFNHWFVALIGIAVIVFLSIDLFKLVDHNEA